MVTVSSLRTVPRLHWLRPRICPASFGNLRPKCASALLCSTFQSSILLSVPGFLERKGWANFWPISLHLPVIFPAVRLNLDLPVVFRLRSVLRVGCREEEKGRGAVEVAPVPGDDDWTPVPVPQKGVTVEDFCLLRQSPPLRKKPVKRLDVVPGTRPLVLVTHPHFLPTFSHPRPTADRNRDLALLWDRLADVSPTECGPEIEVGMAGWAVWELSARRKVETGPRNVERPTHVGGDVSAA